MDGLIEQEKICLIFQPAGIGDVLFLQKICHIYHEKGFKVYLPVCPQILWLADYLPKNIVTICDWGGDFPKKEYYRYHGDSIFTDDFVYLALSTADEKVRGKIMETKYKLLGHDCSDYASYLKFERKKEKEDRLFYDILGLKDDEEYIFLNKNYGTPPKVTVYPVPISTSMRIVEIYISDEFNIFDWCKVYENAKEIHMVETSINYILETLELKADVLNLYSRRPNDFSEVDYLFRKPWNKIK